MLAVLENPDNSGAWIITFFDIREGLMSSIKRNMLFFVFMSTILAGTCFSLPAQEEIGQGRINGTVVDQDGNPVEGAAIVVESLKDGKKLEGTSDDKGNFAVAGMWTGYWRISAAKRGYAPSSIDMNIRQLKRNPPITFTLKKMTGFAALLSDESAFELFEKGNQLTNEEKYDEALQTFEQFLDKYPEVYQVHLNIGQCYLKKGDLDAAKANFQLVLDKTLETHGDYKGDPDAALRSFTGLGEVAIQGQDYEAAQKYFSQALEISPQDEVAALNVGEILFSNQKTDEAIHYYDMAIQIKPDWSKPYLKLGYVYLNKADYEKALEYFNKFIEMDPENPEVPIVKNIIATIEKMKD